MKSRRTAYTIIWPAATFGAFILPAFGQNNQPVTVPPLPAAQPQSDVPSATERQLSALQHDNDKLRQDLAKTRETIDQMKIEVTETRTAIARLSDQVANLTAMVERLLPRAKPATTEERAPVSADPVSSPAAMLAALRARYTRDFDGTRPADNPSRRREEFENWCRQTARLIRGKATWLVRIGPMSPASGTGNSADQNTMMTVLDATTQKPIGEPFQTVVPASFVKQIKESGDNALFEFALIAESDPKYNPDRATPGVFEVPPMVGPYVEFAYKMEWRSLKPIRGSTDDTQKSGR